MSSCLTGKSGSGKSTLIEILAGVTAPDISEVFLDDKPIDLSAIDLFVYGRQKPDIFDETLLFNIAFEPEPQKQAFSQAIENGVLQDIVKCRGVNFSLREGGQSLSGGQLQRVSLSRVLYRVRVNSVILLDKITSSLDKMTAEKVLSNLISKYPDNTIICAIHDLSLRRFFDKEIAIENGRVVGVRKIVG